MKALDYIVKSVKYFAALCVLYTALIWVMYALNLTPVSPADNFRALVGTSRGAVMMIVVAILSALYPRFGFMSRRTEGDTVENREQIMRACTDNGYVLRSEKDGTMTFRADSLPQRASMLFEDEVRISQYGQWIVVEGHRRGVARIMYRLQPYIDRVKNDDEDNN